MPSPPVIRIPKDQLSPAVLDQLRRDLRFRNRAWYQAQRRGVVKMDAIPEHFDAYRESDRYITLPVFIDWKTYGLPIPRLSPDVAPVIKPVTPHVSYRPNQRAAARALDSQLERCESGILSLACGKGKTVLSVGGWAAMADPVPGLAITTTKKITSQWVDRLLQFTDIDRDDIGIIGDGECKWEDKKFVVALVQTLASRTFPQEHYEYFGVTFFDEVHRLGAPYFSIVAGQYHGTRIGLSATWERADGLEKMFMLHIGKVFFEDRTQAVTPDIYFATTPTALDLNRFRMWRGRNRRGEVNHAKVITTLSRDAERHQFIVGHILDAYKEKRKALVLGDRKEELLELQALLPDGAAGICVGTLDGRAQTSEVQDAALRKPIILATSQLVKEGLDQPDIDTLFVLYPQSNPAFAEQAAGRILRQMEGKQPPAIVVLCDKGLYLEEAEGAFHSKSITKVRPFQRICQRMEDTFKRLGYTIKRGVQ